MISFVIPAYNEETLIEQTIRSIHAAAEVVGEPYEIVVADDASTDRTAVIAEAAGAKVAPTSNRQIAATRNAGARASTGKWLIFVDADTEINGELLAATVTALRSGVVGGGARVAFEGKLSPIAKALITVMGPLYSGIGLAAGCYVYCTREAFEAIGGFDETLYASEEVTLSREMRQQGKFLVLKQSVVTSSRKLRAFTLGELFRTAIPIFYKGRKAFEQREGLDVWYGDRSRDNSEPDSGPTPSA